MNLVPLILSAFLWLCVGMSSATLAQIPIPATGRAETLTLSAALQRVFERNPELTASELEIQAASARMLQAGVRPNPELFTEIQNLPAIASGDLFRTTEATVSISQRLEMGAKRDLRVEAARRDKDLAGRNLDLAKTDLGARTRQAFYEVLANQERLRNSGELTRLASQSHSVVMDRVAAGKASPVEQTRSIVALAAAQLEEEKQAKELAASKDRLASLWGGDLHDFSKSRPPISANQKTQISVMTRLTYVFKLCLQY